MEKEKERRKERERKRSRKMSKEEDEMKETVEKMEQKIRVLEAKLNIGRPQHIPPSVPVPRFNGSGDFLHLSKTF